MKSYQCASCKKTSQYLSRDLGVLDPDDYARCVREDLDIDSAVKHKCPHCGFQNLFVEDSSPRGATAKPAARPKPRKRRAPGRSLHGALAMFAGALAVGLITGVVGYFLIDTSTIQGDLFDGVDLPEWLEAKRLQPAIGFFLLGAAPPFLALLLMVPNVLAWNTFFGEQRVMYAVVSAGATYVLGAAAGLLVLSAAVVVLAYSFVGYLACLPLALIPWVGRPFRALGNSLWFFNSLGFKAIDSTGEPFSLVDQIRLRSGIVLLLIIVAGVAIALLTNAEYFDRLKRMFDRSDQLAEEQPAPEVPMNVPADETTTKMDGLSSVDADSILLTVFVDYDPLLATEQLAEWTDRLDTLQSIESVRLEQSGTRERKNATATAEHFRLLEKLPNLRALDLSEVWVDAPTLTEAVGRLKQLDTLRFSNYALEDDSEEAAELFTALAAHPQLRRLHFSGFLKSGAAPLAEMTKLDTFTCNDQSPEVRAAIAELNSLRNLSIDQPDEETLLALLQQMPHLERLQIGRLQEPPRDLEVLKTCAALRILEHQFVLPSPLAQLDYHVGRIEQVEEPPSPRAVIPSPWFHSLGSLDVRKLSEEEKSLALAALYVNDSRRQAKFAIDETGQTISGVYFGPFEVSAGTLSSLTQLSDLKLVSLAQPIDQIGFPRPLNNNDLAPLCEIQTLQYLNLNDTLVGDELVDSLNQLNRLRVLSVQRTRLTPEAVERLRADLPDCDVRY